VVPSFIPITLAQWPDAAPLIQAMPGKIRVADVPHEPTRWWEYLLEPVVLAANVAVTASVYPSWRTARVSWHPSRGVLLDQMAATRRPFILYTWHAYELLTLCATRAVPAAMRLTGIGHDGIKSRMLQRTMAWYGGRIWVYRRRSPVSVRDQIVEMMRQDGTNIVIVADAGGPYGSVKPGLAELARDTQAWLVPFVTLGRGAVWLRRPVRQGIPLPFARLTIQHAGPYDGRNSSVDQCQAWLAELEHRPTAGTSTGQ
jgi:lysophospholipid acyltransferase (LPLAT)-like uncharacterized protein